LKDERRASYKGKNMERETIRRTRAALAVVAFCAGMSGLPRLHAAEAPAEAADNVKMNSRLVAVACSSESRTEEDETLLDILSDTINTIGTYESHKSAAVLPDGVQPKKEDIPDEEFPEKPLYVLTGSRQPAEDGSKTNYVMTLWNIKTGEIPGSNQLEYADVNEVKVSAQLLVAQLFFLVPPPLIPVEPEDFAWRSNLLYFTVNAAGTLRQFSGEREDGISGVTDTPTFSAGLGCEFQFVSTKSGKFGISAEAGAGVSLNYFTFEYNGQPAEYSELSLEFLVTLKANWYPNRFVVSPHGGVYCSVNRGLGFLAGIEAGTKCGNGIMALSLRYSQDIGETSMYGDIAGTREYMGTFTPRSISMGIAYKCGLSRRPQKKVIAAQAGW